MQRYFMVFLGLSLLFSMNVFAQDTDCKAACAELAKELKQHKAMMGKLFSELDELKKTCETLSVDLAAYKALSKELAQELQVAKKEIAGCHIICQKLSKAISEKGGVSQKACDMSDCKVGQSKENACKEGACDKSTCSGDAKTCPKGEKCCKAPSAVKSTEKAEEKGCQDGQCKEGACDKSTCTGDAKTCPKGEKCCKAKTVSAPVVDKTVQIAINKPAPQFSLTDINGKAHQLSDYKGKYVVLEWINFGCPFVKKHYACNNMQELQKKYTEKGVVWLAICSSAPKTQGNMSAKEVQEILNKLQASPSAYLIDEAGSVGRVYQAKVTPHMYIINPDQVLIYQGAIDDNAQAFEPQKIKEAKNYVVNALEAAMNGKPVDVQTTTAYGCSVKYAK